MSTYYCERYDVEYDINTGEILEKIEICGCEQYTCPYTDSWLADGKPTTVPMEYRDHLIHAEMERHEAMEIYDEIEWALMA